MTVVEGDATIAAVFDDFRPTDDAPRRTVNDLLEAAQARIRRLSPREAFEAMGKGHLLVDTRSGEARRSDGEIPGALKIPLSELAWAVDPASGHQCEALRGHERRLILLCAEGYSSSLAAIWLHAIGFPETADVIGGFAGWASEGLPVTRGRARAGTPRTCRSRSGRRTSGA